MSHLISFEGIDASGKTTQIQMLQNWLSSQQKIDVKTIREPGGTSISNKIRTILLENEKELFTDQTEVLLFYAARMNVVEQVIKPALKNGTWIIADRYIDSTRVYQQSEKTLIEHLEKNLKPPLPSLTFFLDIPPDTAKERMSTRSQNNRFDKVSLQNLTNIMNAYKSIAQSEKDRFVTVDANRSIDEVQENIHSIVSARLL